MSYQFESDGLQLVGRLARPERIPTGGVPGLVICHGFPTRSNGVADPGRSYYDLAERTRETPAWIESEREALLPWLNDVETTLERCESRCGSSGIATGAGAGSTAGAASPTSNSEGSTTRAVRPATPFGSRLWRTATSGLRTEQS